MTALSLHGGSRKGLGFATGERRYVLRIVPGDNEVVVGDKEELLAAGLIASAVNWLTQAPPKRRWRVRRRFAIVTRRRRRS